MARRVKLQAEGSHAEIDLERGGTLLSLFLQGQKILWEPKQHIAGLTWQHGGMPILFPFAGRVWWQEREGFYLAGEEVYPMPIHGFLHWMPVELVDEGERHAALSLASSDATRRFFPWDFSLKIVYELGPEVLTCTLCVQNLSVHPLPLACGFHPYFELARELRPTSRLVFSGGEAQLVTAKGAAGAVQAADWLQSTQLDHAPLHNLILRDVQGGEVKAEIGDTRLDPISVKSGPVGCPRSPFVLWARPDEDFFCIEPWMGLPDAMHTGEGLQRIPQGEAYSFAIRIGRLAALSPTPSGCVKV